jgi:HEPN domain-containing protein
VARVKARCQASVARGRHDRIRGIRHGRGAIIGNRQEARQLADEWVIDAELLLNAGRWHAAYYLAGYAVECGLKACVLAHIERTGIIFQDRRFAERCHTHDLEALVKAADLESVLGLDLAANAALRANWGIVKVWNVDRRHQATSEADARYLYQAVTDNANGVLPWIRVRW